MTKKKDIFDDLILPSDDEIKHETHIVRIKQAIKGVPKSEQHKINRKAAMPDQSGINNPFYGQTHTDEVRKIISLKKKGKAPSNKGTQHTQEALEKMSKPRSEEGKANMRKPRSKMLTCPHCGKTGASGNMARYHMDNCKHK